jgi:alpha-tubulin suppressor-like RCC1 family protein
MRTGGGLKFVAISALGDHTCALTATGAAYCWGQNQYGELGAATAEQCSFAIPCSTTPMLVSDPE